jgi:hypothetical protein
VLAWNQIRQDHRTEWRYSDCSKQTKRTLRIKGQLKGTDYLDVTLANGEVCTVTITVKEKKEDESKSVSVQVNQTKIVFLFSISLIPENTIPFIERLNLSL